MSQSIVLGGGCFWCLEAYFQLFKGVLDVTPGYAGGTTTNPTYDAVCNGTGNHAEVVQITYDPSIIALATILQVFWAIHDPTSLNRQGHDVGTQYRSAIYYTNQADEAAIKTSLVDAQALWPSPIVTEIKPLVTFYEAEAYHKNFFLNNPEKAYCQVVINPALQHIKQQFKKLMR
jgi:peptide-methionine (S)-S-oxide reductase